MVSTASTVTAFCTPDTVRLVQWPLIITLLEIPLTATALWSQTMVWFSLMPATLRLSPGGAVGVGVGELDAPGPVVWVPLVEGARLVGELLGVGESMIKLPRVSRCALYAAIPPARATRPTTKNAAKIHNARLADGGLCDAPGNGRP